MMTIAWLLEVHAQMGSSMSVSFYEAHQEVSPKAYCGLLRSLSEFVVLNNKLRKCFFRL